MAMFNPAHPGELIRETIDGIAEETGKRLSIEEVAKGLGTTRKTLSAIINGKQSVTPEMAIKLATGFNNTTPEFWLRVQDNFNLFLARKKVDTKKIKVFWKAAVL
jgi:addiction module HigA family antidote